MSDGLLSFFLHNRVTSVSAEQEIAYLVRIATDSDFKGAVAKPRTQALYINARNRDKFKILEEDYFLVSIVIYSKKDFFLLDALNERLSLFKSYGLLKYYRYQNQEALTNSNQKLPKVFSLKRLLGCFYLLFGGFLLSIVSFVGEIFLFRLKNY